MNNKSLFQIHNLIKLVIFESHTSLINRTWRFRRQSTDVIDDVTKPDPVFNTGAKPERNLNRENRAFVLIEQDKNSFHAATILFDFYFLANYVRKPRITGRATR